MVYNEEDFLQISGLQHFCFCKRQWALIHIENQWKENLRTVEGEIMHERVHDSSIKESRGDKIITRDLRVFSPALGISGNCDVVEFHKSQNGARLTGHDGLYMPYPIEYKHGSPRKDHANELQLCAQAICLEEMLCCNIEEGALFFFETHRREKVAFTQDLREEVISSTEEMRQMYKRHFTPKVKMTKACNACSLKEICLPKLMKTKTVKDYYKEHSED